MTRRGDSPAASTDTEPSKKIRLCTVMVKILQQSASSKPRLQPFPIRIDNKMPAITFDLGTSPDHGVSLVCLYDTCAAVSSGNLLFHQWVITTYPELVHSFVQFDDSNPFEAIKLVGAIKDPDDFNEETHGRLTAVVRYRLPYTDDESNPVVLCIALGTDVSVNTILGWPAIEDLDIEPRFKSNLFVSSTLNHSFRLERVSAPFGLPAGIDFNPVTDFKRPDTPVPEQPEAPAPSRDPAVHFDPRTQLKELCHRLHANTNPIDLLASDPSDTTTMHTRASGAPPPIPISTAAVTTAGYTSGALSLPAS
jgi:hypothetical protein